MNATQMYRALNKGFQHTLPSGVEVTLRMISLNSYVKHGKLPTHLQAISDRVREEGIGPITQQSPEDLNPFYEWVICEALVEPKVTTLPEAVTEEILFIDELPPADQIDIVRVAFLQISRAVEDLRPLSMPRTGNFSSPSTPSPSDTASDPADSSASAT